MCSTKVSYVYLNKFKVVGLRLQTVAFWRGPGKLADKPAHYKLNDAWITNKNSQLTGMGSREHLVSSSVGHYDM